MGDALFEDSVYGNCTRYIADLGRGVVDEEKAEISSTELSRCCVNPQKFL